MNLDTNLPNEMAWGLAHGCGSGDSCPEQALVVSQIFLAILHTSPRLNSLLVCEKFVQEFTKLGVGIALVKQ